MSRRRVTKRERREVHEAVADLGESLLSIRDQRLYAAEYSTFEAFCRARVAASCPAHWRLTPDQAVELAGTALTLADERRRKAGRR